ncbi:uncharacterized protein LOC124288657 [Haliotis rubra]|uniref:uncharacterized protein LOC124288657 n=1 Tax=Haliotis rubra TaxID=36100 RepID=UPI001EE5F21A|nr:uncharacterized protein LOC124288657 [Haliotis rubra]
MTSPRITYDEEEDVSDESEMEIVVLTDPGGSTMRMQKVDNVIYGTPYMAQVLKQIKHVQLRESDIYLTAFLRTGTLHCRLGDSRVIQIKLIIRDGMSICAL